MEPLAQRGTRSHDSVPVVPDSGPDPLQSGDRSSGGDTCELLHSLVREVEDRGAAIARLRSELERARRVRRSFLSCTSHELRTPLNAILCYTDLLAMGALGPLNEQQHRALERTGRAIEQLRHVIDDLFELSELEGGRIHVVPESVDVVELVRAVFAELEPRARERGVPLRLESSRHRVAAHRIIETDAGRLRRLLLLLAEFCLTFTESCGVGIRVRAAESGARIEFEGAGAHGRNVLRQLDLERLASLRPDGARAGIGILIARRLAQQLGIRFEGEPGEDDEGTTLVAHVPPRIEGNEADRQAEVTIARETAARARPERGVKQRAGG